jgi:hypothetical protein
VSSVVRKTGKSCQQIKEENFMDWTEVVKLIVHSLVQILIPFAIIFLAYVIREKFGKDLADKYLEAAGIGVKKAEQVSKCSQKKPTGKMKKEEAMKIARRVLKKQHVDESKIDMDLLDDIIESVVYELNKAKKD